ncbi:17802_t:CDS:10, partial [Dentiscutata erythropus]
VWAITEKVDDILEILTLAHECYTKEHSDKCIYRQISQDGSNLPMSFGDKETTKSSECGLRDPQLDDEKLIEIHKMLVTNKFTPISKKFFQSLAKGGSDFTFQVSKIEYEFINHPTSAIVIGRSGTGKTTSIVFRLVASYMANKKRQIFITVSDNLRDIVIKYFIQLNKSVMIADMSYKTTIKNYEQYLDMNKIPNSFRDSEDEHFPLFITYKKFSEMLLGTFEIDIQKQIKQQKFDTDSEEELCDLYKQKLDCKLVYSEFSVIRGTDPEIDYLSREEYRNISIKRYPTFCHNRKKIYDLFLRYNEMKSRNGDYDPTDRTMFIICHAKKHAFGCLQINEVYIDECQDNHIVDIALILKLFNNANVIFLAGDVAQCIACGSSFRFQSVRSLMYIWELDRFERSLTNYNRRDAINLKQFELNINYRSHNQILQLASSVIDLIWYFFPDSIDKLSCEHSEVGGLKPVAFSEVRAKDLIDIFYIDEQGEHETNHIEFGARQIIIVRDDEARQHVENLIGEAEKVETVFDCKGMEFDDVLLYNFFTNSPACEKKHSILCSELKQLYVAITRGRRSVWIFDENTKYSDPMRTYWEQKELIRIRKDAKEITLFAKESRSQEWDEERKEFLDKKNFRQASFCFKKSGNKKLCDLFDAYYLQQIARDSVNFFDNATKKKNYTCAAQAFKTCSETFLEAPCYEEGEIYEEAIDIYIKLEEYDHAARCYHKNNNLEKAVNVLKRQIKYVREEEIKEAKELRSRGKFEEAANMFINTIKGYDTFTKSLQCLLYLCRIYALNMIKDRINSNALEELNRLYKKAINIINKAKSQKGISEKPQQWDILIEELQLYEAYLNNNANQLYEYIIHLKNREDVITEFRAITIWPKISQEIYEKYHYRLEFLLRLYKISILFMVLYDNVGKNHKDFERIFAVNAGNADKNILLNNPNNRQISYDNLLIHIIDKFNLGKGKVVDNYWYVYKKNVIYCAISKSLSLYIQGHILKIHEYGKEILAIAFEICRECASSSICQNKDKKRHHVKPTQLILYDCLKIAFIQYAAIYQLDAIRKEFKKYENFNVLHKFFNEFEGFNSMQIFWENKLIRNHFRYQSSQLSCPKITNLVISEVCNNILCDGFENFIHRKIYNKFRDDDFNDFAILLNYLFVLIQQQSDNLIEFCENALAITYNFEVIGEKLLSFILSICSKDTAHIAFNEILEFIGYIAENNKSVKLDSTEAFSDLTSLMELTTTLIVASQLKNSDFCFPQSYLFNYLNPFKIDLFSIQYEEDENEFSIKEYLEKY